MKITNLKFFKRVDLRDFYGRKVKNISTKRLGAEIMEVNGFAKYKGGRVSVRRLISANWNRNVFATIRWIKEWHDNRLILKWSFPNRGGNGVWASQFIRIQGSPKRLEKFFREDIVYKQDKIIGSKRNDILLGWDDHDMLSGGAGDDVLIGGDGKNTYKGGKGKDLFVIQEDLDSKDIIKDFKIGVDSILLYEGYEDSDWTYKINGRRVRFITGYYATGYYNPLVVQLPNTRSSTIDAFLDSVKVVDTEKQLNKVINDWIA